jgi:hypothetical protein
MAEHVKRQKGETQGQYNRRAHRIHKAGATDRKKQEGRWLSKEEYEKRTGRLGRSD